MKDGVVEINLFISKYSVDEENEVVKLFSSKFIGYISLMIIDGKKIENIVNNYNFTKKGNHTVELEFKENCESLDYLFFNCPKLIEVNINEVKVKQLKNMRGLFSESGRLTKVTFGKNFTTSNVTDIREMFKDCTSLKELNLTNFDTSKVTNMNKLFYNCIHLESIDVSNFDTKNVKDMSYLFYGCTERKSLDVKNFDTSNV